MKIYIQNEEFFYTNEVGSARQVIDKINEILNSGGFIFSHITVDGVDVFNSHEEYLIKNISFIEEVKVELHTPRAFLLELLNSTHVYLSKLEPLIENLGNHFYQSSLEDAWGSLNDFLEGVQWILSSLEGINEMEVLKSYTEALDIWKDYNIQISNLKNILPDLMQAMENHDDILIGDILSYEVKEIVSNMNNVLPLLIKKVEGDQYAH